MKLNELLHQLNQLAKERPEALEMELEFINLFGTIIYLNK